MCSYPDDFVYVHIDVEDCVHDSIAMHFDKVHKIIQDAERENVSEVGKRERWNEYEQ